MTDEKDESSHLSILANFGIRNTYSIALNKIDAQFYPIILRV